VEQTWREDGEDSDAASIDSDQEDILKYAGVYTTEEVAQVLRDKLIRLQALYIDQFKRLKHVLLAKRRDYLVKHRAEKEALGSVKLYKKAPGQRQKYDKLCAMRRYHRKFGKEALLQKQCTERRKKVTQGLEYSPPVFPKCVFTDDDVTCGAQTVPMSDYCPKHILHDPHQVLYRPCPFADSQCGRPVPRVLPHDTCSLHQKLQPLRQEELSLPELKAEIKQEPGLFSQYKSSSSRRHSGHKRRRSSETPQRLPSQQSDIDIKTEEENDIIDTDMTNNPGVSHSELDDIDIEEAGTVDIEGHDTSGEGGSGLFTVEEMEEEEEEDEEEEFEEEELAR